MSNPRERGYELTFICPVCGDKGYAPNSDIWAYKREVNENGTRKMLYFCHYRCVRKHDREHEKEIIEGRKQAAKKRQQKRGTPNPTYFCEDCRYFSEGRYGFYDCSVNPHPVKPGKAACYKFKLKFGSDTK